MISVCWYAAGTVWCGQLTLEVHAAAASASAENRESKHITRDGERLVMGGAVIRSH